MNCPRWLGLEFGHGCPEKFDPLLSIKEPKSRAGPHEGTGPLLVIASRRSLGSSASQLQVICSLADYSLMFTTLDCMQADGLGISAYCWGKGVKKVSLHVSDPKETKQVLVFWRIDVQ